MPVPLSLDQRIPLREHHQARQSQCVCVCVYIYIYMYVYVYVYVYVCVCVCVGFLRRTEACGQRPSFYLVRTEVLSLVGEETTQGQHTDCSRPCIKLSKATFRPWHSWPCYKVATKTSTPQPPQDFLREWKEGNRKSGAHRLWNETPAAPSELEQQQPNGCTRRHVKLMPQTAQLGRRSQARKHCTIIACFRIPLRCTLRVHPAGFLRRTEACGQRPSFYLVRTEVLSLVGEETTQGQHTDCSRPCIKLSKATFRPWHSWPCYKVATKTSTPTSAIAS